MNFHLGPMVPPSSELEILILLQPWVFTNNLSGPNLILNLHHTDLILAISILRGKIFMAKVIRSKVDTRLNLACTNLTNTRPTRQICTEPARTNPTSQICTNPTSLARTYPTSPTCTNLTSPTCTNPTSPTCTSPTCTHLACTNPTSPICTSQA